MNAKVISINTATNELGNLSFIEEFKDTPFPIKRIYYIYDVPCDSIRGKHAHKTLQQFWVCLNGKIKVVLNDGIDQREFILDRRDEGLYVGAGIWREMKFVENDSVLMVVASDYYDEQDYIRDYNQFINYKRMGLFDENRF